MNVLRLLAAALLAAVPHLTLAADADPIVAENATETVRLSEFEAELERVPPENRNAFLSNRQRVGDLLGQMLVRKTLATQAKAEKLDEDPANVARVRAENQRLLAQLRIASVEKVAAAEFEAKLAEHQRYAREIYLVDREKFRVPEEISASHILFDVKKHSSEDARKLAERARARVTAGEEFASVAREVSEDPSAASNGGALGWFKRETMDPKFSQAAFALKQNGAISEPVLSQFGWHIIRLEGRKEATVLPFESVRDQIVADLRNRHISQARDAVLEKIRNDPKHSLNEPVLEDLVAKARAGRSSPRAQR
jgi:peptidyl-prolyl cis-trans isomerase C